MCSFGAFEDRVSLKNKTHPQRIKDGKKNCYEKENNIGFPILSQIYVFYLKR
jgi:hypothetical protein